MTSLLLVVSAWTPWAERTDLNRSTANPIVQGPVRALTWALKRIELYEELLAPQAFVAPSVWPEMVREVLPPDPPSPYEVACAVLRYPTGRFWQFSKVDRGHYAALMWWLTGISEDAICRALQLSDQSQLHSHISWALRGMRGRRKFDVWALGLNLQPVASTLTKQRALMSYLKGVPFPRATRRRHSKILAAMLRHPFVEAQVIRGQADGPVTRPVYMPGVVWKTQEDKDAWREGGSAHWYNRRVNRITAREGKKQRGPAQLVL